MFCAAFLTVFFHFQWLGKIPAVWGKKDVVLLLHEKSKIPFSYMLYAYSVKRAYRGTKPKESFR